MEGLIFRKLKKDLTGTQQGDFRVIKYIGSKATHKRSYYLCECLKCNRIIETTFNIKNKIKSCRHCVKGLGKDHYAWKGFGDIPKNIFTTYRHGAKARNISFNITIEEIWDLFLKQDGKCAFTGWDLTFNKTYRNKKVKTASLDRIDSSKGYEISNLQWVHKDINKLKKNMQDANFIELCHAVSNYKK